MIALLLAIAVALPSSVSLEDAQGAVIAQGEVRTAQLDVRIAQLELDLARSRLEAKKAEAAGVVARIAARYTLDPSRGDGWDEHLTIHRASTAAQKDAKP